MKAKDTIKEVDWNDYDSHNRHWKVGEMLRAKDIPLLSKSELAELETIAKTYLESVKQEGIREVVGWIETHDESTCMDCSCAFAFRIDEWQAQVKKWRVKCEPK